MRREEKRARARAKQIMNGERGNKETAEKPRREATEKLKP